MEHYVSSSSCTSGNETKVQMVRNMTARTFQTSLLELRSKQRCRVRGQWQMVMHWRNQRISRNCSCGICSISSLRLLRFYAILRNMIMRISTLVSPTSPSSLFPFTSSTNRTNFPGHSLTPPPRLPPLKHPPHPWRQKRLQTLPAPLPLLAR